MHSAGCGASSAGSRHARWARGAPNRSAKRRAEASEREATASTSASGSSFRSSVEAPATGAGARTLRLAHRPGPASAGRAPVRATSAYHRALDFGVRVPVG